MTRAAAFLGAMLLAGCRNPSIETSPPPIATIATANGFVPSRDVDVVDQPDSPRVVGRLHAGTNYPDARASG